MEDDAIDQIAFILKGLDQHLILGAIDAALDADVQVVAKHIANFGRPYRRDFDVLVNRTPIEMLVIAKLFIANFNMLDVRGVAVNACLQLCQKGADF